MHELYKHERGNVYKKRKAKWKERERETDRGKNNEINDEYECGVTKCIIKRKKKQERKTKKANFERMKVFASKIKHTKYSLDLLAFMIILHKYKFI